MTAPTARKLGRFPLRLDERTLQLCCYLEPDMPVAPPTCRWDTPIKEWGVMGNDRFGNCVIATAGHEILTFRATELHDTKRITDSAVIELSRKMGALDGYNILDRLKYWRKKGMWANRLWAFTAIDQSNRDHIKTAVSIFGAADIGINLPTAWQDDPVWDVGHGPRYSPGSWGGHSVPIVGYDTQGVYIVTWGAVQRMTWQALPVYCDEAYALIDEAWIAANGFTPLGLDLTTLRADLTAITQ